LVKSRSIAVANDPAGEDAANDYLLSGGSAIGAVLAGYFAAAGAYAGVLLSPISILVGGTGMGARAFDGRLRQPGLGTKRPRGFRADEPIPEAARIAIPTSVAAALVAQAYDGEQKLRAIMKASIARAERSGAEGRVELLKRIRAVGATALSEPAFTRPLLHVAGPSQGGLVTPADFGKVGDVDREAEQYGVGSVTVFEPPWSGEATPECAAPLGIGCAVLAVDVHGVLAAAAYRRVTDGLVIEELELEAPLVAVPVERGVPRVAPGARLPAPAPLAFVKSNDATYQEIVSSPADVRLDSGALSAAQLRIRRDANGQVTVENRRLTQQPPRSAGA
jgi:gamma-glutamyltranspeptidase/glutathione hydrolase